MRACDCGLDCEPERERGSHVRMCTHSRVLTKLKTTTETIKSYCPSAVESRCTFPLWAQQAACLAGHLAASSQQITVWFSPQGLLVSGDQEPLRLKSEGKLMSGAREHFGVFQSKRGPNLDLTAKAIIGSVHAEGLARGGRGSGEAKCGRRKGQTSPGHCTSSCTCDSVSLIIAPAGR